MTQTDPIQEKIIEEFFRLGDWLDKYEHLIRLGKTLKPSPADLKTEAKSISGCQAKVWLSAELKDGRMYFSADSDAQITRGIIALLLQVLDGRTPEDVFQSDLYFIDRIGLSRHLSPSRANGLASIVKRMKDLGKMMFL